MRTRRTRPLTLASFPPHFRPALHSLFFHPARNQPKETMTPPSTAAAPRDHCVARSSASRDIPAQSPPAQPHLIFPPHPLLTRRASLEYPNQCSLFIEALAKPLDGGVAQVSFALRLGHDQAKRPCDRRQRRDVGLSVWDLNRSGRLQAWHGWRSGRNRRQGSLSRRLVRRGA